MRISSTQHVPPLRRRGSVLPVRRASRRAEPALSAAEGLSR